MLVECANNDIEYVVMEVSSQGLAYNRVDGIKFDYAVFTNLTEDHLDYHKTMDNYLKAKQKLFKKLKKDGISIINKDDKYYKNFITKNNVTYGKDGDYKISNIDYNKNKMIFKFNDETYKTSLLGDYNVYNVSIVIIVLQLLNIKENQIKETIKKLKSAPGRMDMIKYKTNMIIVDYAHTPDAVEKVLNNTKCKGRKITIIGCGGNRDKNKRSIMGGIASLKSDYVIYTSDNPRYENEIDIIKDMIQKLDTFNFEIEVNREKAIKKGIQMLKKNDILLVLGKGHETYQEIKGVKYPFNDYDTVLKYIRR